MFIVSSSLSMKVRDSKSLKIAENFKYFGAWTQSTEKNIATRKATQAKIEKGIDFKASKETESEVVTGNNEVCSSIQS